MNNTQHALLRWSGIAGIVAAIAWTIGDALLLGNTATAADYPFMADYDNTAHPSVENNLVESSLQFLNSSTERLAAGALVAVFTTPLYLIGFWHIYQASKVGGRGWSLPPAVMLLGAYTFAPFVHGSFFYVAEILKTMTIVDPASRPALIDLAARTSTWLFIAYGVLAVPTLIGLIWVTLAVALGKTLYPRWVAIANPIVLMVIGSVSDSIMPIPLSLWLQGAGLNLGLLGFFTLSTIVLWNRGAQQPA